ncbi:MAG: hypothetical protein ACI9VM_000080, partial [Candidatus Azotimanducaceae bacterium]
MSIFTPQPSDHLTKDLICAGNIRIKVSQTPSAQITTKFTRTLIFFLLQNKPLIFRSLLVYQLSIQLDLNTLQQIHIFAIALS